MSFCHIEIEENYVVIVVDSLLLFIICIRPRAISTSTADLFHSTIISLYSAFLLSPHRVCQVIQDFQDHQEKRVSRVMRVCPANQDCKAPKEIMEASVTQVGFPSVTFILFFYKQSYSYYNNTSCGSHSGVCLCVSVLYRSAR